MKKGFALVMASMMALSLTACGGNASSATTAADTSAADTKAEGTTAAAPADKIGLAGSGKELIFTTGGSNDMEMLAQKLDAAHRIASR